MSASPDRYPRLLCVPAADGRLDERVLDLAEWRYAVAQDGDTWTVTVRGTGDVIYRGPGPVEVRGSPAPF